MRHSPTTHYLWVQQPATYRMSMRQFRSQVHHHLANVMAFENPSRHITAVLVCTHGRLPLSYSDHVTTTFTALDETLEHFCSFLEETSKLPLVLTALFYGFLSPLLFLRSQVRAGTILVEELCLSYSLRPSETKALSQRAKWANEALVEHLMQLPTTINALLDRASFHEAHLAALTEG